VSRPRLHDDGYLAFLRTKPCCCGCGRPAPSEAAHVKIGWFTMAKKPDDRFCVPLNAWCHRGPGQQHDGEAAFWEARGLDPFAIAERLYAEYDGTGGAPKAKRKPKKRPPPEKRQKIRSRHGWPKRRMR
jgi:hypothetical protein